MASTSSMCLLRNSIRFTYFVAHKVSRRCFSRGLWLCQEKFDAVEELKTNPYYEKYAEKIATLRKTSPAEFEDRLQAARKKPSKQVSPENTSTPIKDITEGEIAQAMSSKRGSLSKKPTYTPKKTLDSLMKVDMLKDKTSDEIANIWQEFHKNRQGIYAVIPADVYDTIERRALEFPTFVFPIPRKSGFEFIMSQFSGQECHFTPLINYQAHGENAPVCFTVIHYPELRESKGIVLMCGEYDENVVQAPEAQCLANQLQMYYGGQEFRKKALLWTFTNDPRAFKHSHLIAELERSLSNNKS